MFLVLGGDIMSVVEGRVEDPDTADCAGDWMFGSFVTVVTGVVGGAEVASITMGGVGTGTPRAAAKAFM